MKELSEYEWAVLGEIARSLVENLDDGDLDYIWTTGTTLVNEEVKLLKKIAE